MRLDLARIACNRKMDNSGGNEMSNNQFGQFEPRSAPLPAPGRERVKTFTEVLSERAQLENRMKDIDADLRKQNMDAEDIHHPRVPRYNYQEYPKMLYHSDGKT